MRAISKPEEIAYAQADGAGQAKALVVGVPDAYRKPASLEGCLQIEDTKHLHTITRDSELFAHDTDVSKAQSFYQGFHDLDIWDGNMGWWAGGVGTCANSALLIFPEYEMSLLVSDI